MTVLRKRYRIVAPIGEGGQGSVFVADDLRLPGRQCAIKRVRAPSEADAATSARIRAAFAREAALLARLDHPSLPKVSDAFEVNGVPWLVMDYVPGQDLRSLVVDARSRGRQLEESQVVRWAEDLCRALTYLHGQTPPVIHGDVKPANVKLAPDGRIYLVDFGLARQVADADAPTSTVLAGAGTRPYQALEQYGPDAVPDGRSDVYGLGATVYHLLVGRAPASAQGRFLDPASLAVPRTVRPDLSVRVEAAVMAALALHPDGRPASAEALRRMLVAPEVDTSPAEWTWGTVVTANAALVAAVVTLAIAALAVSLGP